MNKEKVLGVLRHVLSLVAAFLVMRGISNSEDMTIITGAVIQLTTVMMSWNSLDKTELVQQLYGALRQVVTFLGGVGVFGNMGTEKYIQEILSGLVVIIGSVLSWTSKEKINA